MIILGIETSCDETSVAIVQDGHRVLAVSTASSEQFHSQTGGIIPDTAARKQLSFMIPVLTATLKQFSPQQSAPEALKKIDALAVTQGPGLIGSLLVGTQTGKTLSLLTNKPIVPVNHLEAHIFGNWLEKEPDCFPPLPGLALIASGGHTEIIWLEKKARRFSFSRLGGTRDDAAGECFDKCARALGLGYPGGPAIAKLAKQSTNIPSGQSSIKLPRPMLNQNNFDFSFSGLKTALINQIARLKSKGLFNQEAKLLLAREVQDAIVQVLVTKTIAAATKYQPQSLLLGGGVTANQALREEFTQLTSQKEVDLFIPQIRFCTDNGTIVAAAAYFNYFPQPWSKITASSSLEIKTK